MKPTLRFVADPTAKDVQTNVRELVEGLDESTGGRVLLNRTIGTTETRVKHDMGAKPTGCAVFSVRGNAVVWESTDADATYLYLTASVAVVCGLKVF